MKTILFILLSILFFISCTKAGVPVQSIQQADDYNVEYLFTVEGVKVFRFYDNGYTKYLAIGDGSIISDRHSNGKYSTDNQVIQAR